MKNLFGLFCHDFKVSILVLYHHITIIIISRMLSLEFLRGIALVTFCHFPSDLSVTLIEGKKICSIPPLIQTQQLPQKFLNFSTKILKVELSI